MEPRSINLKNYLTKKEICEQSSKIKKVFFYRVCGTGMGAAATLLKEKGFIVEGGDSAFLPPMSTYLEESGISLHNLENVDALKLQEFDLIVVGNVVPRNSDDAKLIEESGVPFVSFPAALGGLVLDNCHVIGVSGTHGKTTTTYFFTQVFEKLGEVPGYFIGGVMEGRPSSRLGEGKYFFIESDEYDSAYFEKISKFNFYSINHLLITSLEFDHADIFNNLEEIKDQFRKIIGDVDKGVTAMVDYPAIVELLEEFNLGSALTYGEASGNGPKVNSVSNNGTVFELKLDGKWEKFETNIIGPHNILNLSSVIFYAASVNFPITNIRDAVSSLLMVKKRQELKGHHQGAPIIDDFAHHPRAVKLTIEGIRSKYPNKKINVIFEPHSATARSSLFQNDFCSSLSLADKVLFVPSKRPTSVKEADDFNCEEVSKILNEKKVLAKIAFNLDEVVQFINEETNPDSVILVLSNGSCMGLWQSDLISNLS